MRKARAGVRDISGRGCQHLLPLPQPLLPPPPVTSPCLPARDKSDILFPPPPPPTPAFRKGGGMLLLGVRTFSLQNTAPLGTYSLKHSSSRDVQSEIKHIGLAGTAGTGAGRWQLISRQTFVLGGLGARQKAVTVWERGTSLARARK